MYFPDCMADIETTGTQPDRTGMIQLALVPFNLKEMAVSSDVFCRSLTLPPHRMWDESTRQWWMQQKQEILQGIIDVAEPPAIVMEDFHKWTASQAIDMTFWSKPLSFDFPFIASYCRDYEYPMPFHYRKARDVNTFIMGRWFPEQPPTIEVANDGAHNALNDAFAQIELLFRHYDRTRNTKEITQ